MYMLQVLTKKSALKSKDFFTLCIYPSLEKKDILSTFSELCYCRQKKIHLSDAISSRNFENIPGQQGTDEDLLADLQLLPTSS